ncbi:MAG TPA: O-antigen ligase family protein [Candidatus Sulfotelmatobacter sp.]|nr:O-antigen ligase family protein [Candidatus Sulfotelmatobacter sp.]
MRLSERKFGVPEWVIIALPVTAALGTYLLPIQLGVSFFAFRILVIFVAIFLVVTGRGIVLNFGSLSRWFFYSGLIWVIWGAFALIWSSLLWGTDIQNGLIEVLAVIFGFLPAAVLLNLVFRARNGLEALRLGWTLAFVATALVALWEVVTGSHLPGFQEELLAPSVGLIAMSTFGNPNNYAAFLSLCFPFLIWSLRVATGWRRAIYLFLSLLLLVALVATGGRLALVAIGLECLLLILFVSFPWKRLVLAAAVTVGVLATVAFPGFMADNESVKLFRLYSELTTGGSATIRLNLLKDSVALVQQSWGSGIGPANFSHMLMAGQGPYPTEGYVNPHNFWAEIATQYGLLVFVVFVGWLTLALWSAWKSRKDALACNDHRSRLAAETAILGIVGYFLAAAENSSYITQQTNWMFLASILVVGCSLSGACPRIAAEPQ